MWYEFHQTEINGEYIYNDKLCGHIMIEANNCEEANRIAESLGVCFEGNEEYSEPCRWERCYYEFEFPSRWDDLVFNDPEDYACFIYNRRHKVGANHTSPHSRLHYRDGKVREIG